MTRTAIGGRAGDDAGPGAAPGCTAAPAPGAEPSPQQPPPVAGVPEVPDDPPAEYRDVDFCAILDDGVIAGLADDRYFGEAGTRGPTHDPATALDLDHGTAYLSGCEEPEDLAYGRRFWLPLTADRALEIHVEVRHRGEYPAPPRRSGPGATCRRASSRRRSPC